MTLPPLPDLGPEWSDYWRNKVNTIMRNYGAACAAAERSPWQPIETAPKDGRKLIMFYLNRNRLPRRVMARWLTDEQASEMDGDGVGLGGGWYECIDNWEDFSQVAIYEGEPSHWMPLPEPPAAKIRGQE